MVAGQATLAGGGGARPRPGRLSEVACIPLIDYAAVFALAAIIGGILGLIRLLSGTRREAGIR